MRALYALLLVMGMLCPLFAMAHAKPEIDIALINHCSLTVEIQDAIIKSGGKGDFKITNNRPLTITVLSYPGGYTYSVDLIKTDEICSRWSQVIPNGRYLLVRNQRFCAQETKQPNEINVLLILTDGINGTCHAQLININNDLNGTEAGPLYFTI